MAWRDRVVAADDWRSKAVLATDDAKDYARAASFGGPKAAEAPRLNDPPPAPAPTTAKGFARAVDFGDPAPPTDVYAPSTARQFARAVDFGEGRPAPETAKDFARSVDFGESVPKALLPDGQTGPGYQGFGKAFLAGIDDLQGLTASALQAGGELVGADSFARDFGRIADANTGEAEQYGNRGKFSDISSVGDAFAWAGQTAGNLIPVAIPAFVGGVAGAAAAPEVGVGAAVGGVIGAFLPSEVLGVGEVQSAMKDKDPQSRAGGWVFAGGTAIAALDTVLPGHVGGKLVARFGREGAEEIALRTLLRPASASMVAAVAKTGAKEAAKDALIEGTTESLQEAIGEVAAAQAAEKPVDWQSLPGRMLEAGAAGALFGAAAGGAHGSIEGYSDARSAAPRPRPATIREQATTIAADSITPDDEASPLDTADIAAGRAGLIEAEAGQKADKALTGAGLPKTGARVAVTMPDGKIVPGTMADHFSDETGDGVVIDLDGGRKLREYADTLADAGVTIAPLDRTAEADALDAQLAASAATPFEPAPDVPVEPLPANVSRAQGGASPGPSGRNLPGGTGGALSGGREAFLARVGGAENASGSNTAKNPNSSASGRYQFTDATWAALGGKPGGKSDPAEQERLMGKLTDQNEAALKRGGIALTPGNYYLAHFAGAGGATALHRNPDAPVEQILGADVVKANPFLAGMKGRDVIEWAAQKMGGKAGVGNRDADSINRDGDSNTRDDIAFAQANREGGFASPVPEAGAERAPAEVLPPEEPATGTGVVKPAARYATVKVGNTERPISDFAEASRAYRETIDKMDIGGSQTPPAAILDSDGNQTAHIAYNGRVFAGRPQDWTSDTPILYDNRASTTQNTAPERPEPDLPANNSQELPTTPSPEVSGTPAPTLEPTASGKGVAIGGLTERQITAIRTAGVPIPPVRSDGKMVFSAKRADDIRRALAGVTVTEAEATKKLLGDANGDLIDIGPGYVIGEESDALKLFRRGTDGKLSPITTLAPKGSRREIVMKAVASAKKRAAEDAANQATSDQRKSNLASALRGMTAEQAEQVARRMGIDNPAIGSETWDAYAQRIVKGSYAMEVLEHEISKARNTKPDIIQAAKASGRLEIVDTRAEANRETNRRNAATAREGLGASAFRDGTPRVPPSEMSADDKRSWLAGWDRANLAAPLPDDGGTTDGLTPAEAKRYDDLLTKSVQAGGAGPEETREMEALARKKVAARVADGRNPYDGTAKPAQFADNTLFTADKVEAARARMKAKMGRLNAGVDPELLIDGMTIAGAYVESGVRNFAQFAKTMRDDFGDKITPYLLSFWEGVRNYPGLTTEGMTPPDASKAMSEMLLAGMSETGEPLSDTEVSRNTTPAAAAAPTPPPSAVAAAGPLSPATAAGPVEALRDHLLNGGRFASIVDARKFLANLTGQEIRPGTAEAKRADETIEAAIVQAARKIAAREAPALETYRALVDLYERQPNLSVRSSTSVEQQAYSTPVPLAFLASQRAGINQDTTVYEPSAGNGALLIDARATYVTANELNPGRAAQLREIYRGATITTGDAMRDNLGPKQFDRVIANPPFGVVKDEDGDSREFDMGDGYETREIDHAISLKALEKLKDGGRAALIVGGINKQITGEEARANAYNARAKRLFYYRIYREYNVTDHFTVAGELYSRQGAGWPVDVIVIEGRGRSKLPLPAVKAPRQYASWGELEQELAKQPEVSGEAGSADGRAPDRFGRPAGGDAGARTGSDGGRADTGRGDSAPVEPAAIRDRPVRREPGSAGPGEREGAVRGDATAPRQVREPGRDRKRTEAQPELAEGESPSAQVAYVPASGAQSLDTLVPFNMQTAIQSALDKVEQQQGSVDAFVADRLGYARDKLGDYFSAEQIDALALALDNMERGAGFIIGDQTGIGKGRVVAGVIRYAMKSGRKPIFVTEKPTLYADMYRDLADIGVPEMLGRDIEIVMTNAGERVPLDDGETNVLRSSGAASHNALLARAADGGHDFDVLFTTYNQMQTQRGATTPRQQVIAALAPGGIVIFDESHNAGGQGPDAGKRKTKKQKDAEKASEAGLGPMPPMNRAQFARHIAGLAHGVFFSSATYAKRPEVMDLYASTDMHLAVADPQKLGEAIAKGGIPMQQVVASALAEAGQYVRRERSFAGVEYRTPRVDVDRATYEQVTEIIGGIREFEDEWITDSIKAIDQEVRSDAQSVSHDGSVGGAGASSTNFTSVMHNVIEQMLLSLKADPAATRAIEALKSGKKPVITLANTMGSFIQDYAEENGLGQGSEVPLDFGAVFLRYLDRTRHYTVKQPFSAEKGEKKYISDEELGPAGLAAFKRVEALIRGVDFGDLPVSPIDHIRQRLIADGYKVAEITGRHYTLDYSGAVPTLRIRPGKETSVSGKRDAISGFNNGKIDAMILNQSGSTGISLHASEKVKDQRKRLMVIAQAERNVDTHMQILGRVHRTGQVVLPEYDQLVADVPAEMRPAAVLAKKMASLNANTTGARGSAMTGDDIPDFMNEFGDEIAARMMEEDSLLHERLGSPVKESQGEEEGLNREDAARKVTGRLMLLPLGEQEDFYSRFIEEYQSYLAQKEAAGEATLEAKMLPLDARPIASTPLVAATKPGSPFGEAVNMEVLDVKRLGRPMSPEQIVERVAEAIDATLPNADPGSALSALEGQGGRWLVDKVRAPAFDEFDGYRQVTLDNASEKSAETMRPKLAANRAAFDSLSAILVPGAGVSIETNDGDRIGGIVLSLERKGKTKNPIALSGWQATIAVADAARQVTIPLSQLRTASMDIKGGGRLVERARYIDGKPLLEAFATMQTESREKRIMLTGNILAAYGETGGRGQIVNFIGADGSVRSGILMRRAYDHAKEVARKPVDFRTAAQVATWLATGEKVFGDDISLEVSGGQLVVIAAAAKGLGGKYYLNSGVRAAVGGDFYKKSTGMVAETSAQRAEAVAAAVMKAGAVLRAKTNLEAAREIVASEGAAPRESRAPDDLPTVSVKTADWGKLPAPGKARLAILRPRVMRWYEGLVGTTVTTADGKAVHFNPVGMKKTTRAGEDLLMLARAVPKIIARGALIGSEKSTRGGMIAVHRYAANVRAEDGAVTPLVVMVREAADGSFHYSLNRYLDEGASDAPAEAGRETQQSRAVALALEGGAEDSLNLFAADEFRKDVAAPGDDLSAKRDELRAALEPILTQILGDKVALRIMDGMAGKAQGLYWPGRRVIEIALDTRDGAPFVLNHEIIHALRDMGVFSASDWSLLVAAAKRDPEIWRSVGKRYSDLNLDGREEEAVADLFAAYQDGLYKAKGPIERAFMKIVKLLSALRNGLRSAGFKTTRTFREVFDEVASGEAAKREGTGEQGRAFRPAFGPKDEAKESRARATTEEMTILAGSEPTWRATMGDRFDRFRKAMQDRYLPLLRVQQDIERQTGRQLPLRLNPYLGEELMARRMGARLEALVDDHVGPLFDAMHAEKVSKDELESYVYARHAPERNARMHQINPEIPEGEGSGMTDLEAAAIMNRAARAGKTAALDRLAARVDAIIQMAKDYRNQSGLMSQEDVDAWDATYEHYVPLRGFKEVEGANPAAAERINRSGGGLNVRGKESKRAFGRRSEADSILAYVILQAQEAIVRAETNRVTQRVINLARAAPDEEFWEVNKVTQKQRINEETGLVERYLATPLLAEDKDWTVSAKFNGKEARVTMNRANPAAVRLADSLRRLTEHKLDFVTQYLGAVNRFLSAVNTRYNPEFVITNAFRDMQSGYINLLGEDADGLAKKTAKLYPGAMKASFKGAFGNTTGEWGRWYKEFEMAGGKTAFNRVDDVAQIKQRIEKAIQNAAVKAGDASALLKTKQALLAVRDAIENVNDGVENAVRLAAYRAARESGLSPDRAASIATNVTVNFNRHGTVGPLMNAFYLFYNAGTQGTAVIFKNLHKPKVQKMVAGIMLGGFLLELLNAMVAGDDDDGESYYDKISDFDKSRNLIVALGGSKFIKLPMPYGYNAFFAIGRSAAEIMRRGGDRWTDTAGNLASTILEAFNPIGGAENLLKFFSPTILDPIVDLEQNKDFTGRPIMPKENQYGPEEPDHSRYWSSVGTHWLAITDFLNEGTGGTSVEPGVIDVSPETLEYLAGTAFGAAGAFLDRVIGIPAKALSGDLEVNDIPLVRKVVGDKPGWYDKAAFYDRLDQVEQAVSFGKDYLEAERFDEARTYVDRNEKILGLETAMKDARREMRVVRKAKKENEHLNDLGKIDAAAYKAEVEVTKRAEDMVIRQFNTQWNTTFVGIGRDSAGEGE